MHELKKTAFFCLAAGVLAAAAVIVDPGAARPEIFSDQGEAFYPEFTDPLAPKAIEVIDYDEATATARPLKVEFAEGKWRIPSHHNYPADAADRLPKTAAALMELRKDMIVSDRVEDHAEYGVIDPLDQAAASLSGRGKRVTLRDGNGGVLADFVVGKNVPDKPGYRYLRVPSQRRTYAVKTDADVSSRFADWIETDLLKLSAGDIRKVAVNSYSINEQLGRLDDVERLTLAKSGENWTLSGGGKPNAGKIELLTGALDNLRIVNVQPKPQNLTEDLRTSKGIQLSMESVYSLRQKGFFITQTGQLFSNQGEIIVDTANGLQYTLRFGEVASTESATATESAAATESAGGETPAGEAAQSGQDAQRYLFITVSYSEARARQYAGGKDPGKEGEELARELRNRFADWYYVISGTDFNNLRPSRRSLLRG
jgi:Domain of unknown function (DUF4340)